MVKKARKNSRTSTREKRVRREASGASRRAGARTHSQVTAVVARAGSAHAGQHPSGNAERRARKFETANSQRGRARRGHRLTEG